MSTVSVTLRYESEEYADNHYNEILRLQNTHHPHNPPLIRNLKRQGLRVEFQTTATFQSVTDNVHKWIKDQDHGIKLSEVITQSS